MLLFGDKLNTIKDITITGKHAKYLVHNIKEAIGFDFTLTGVMNLILLNCQRFDAYKWPNTQHPG